MGVWKRKDLPGQRLYETEGDDQRPSSYGLEMEELIKKRTYVMCDHTRFNFTRFAIPLNCYDGHLERLGFTDGAGGRITLKIISRTRTSNSSCVAMNVCIRNKYKNPKIKSCIFGLDRKRDESKDILQLLRKWFPWSFATLLPQETLWGCAWWHSSRFLHCQEKNWDGNQWLFFYNVCPDLTRLTRGKDPQRMSSVPTIIRNQTGSWK